MYQGLETRNVSSPMYPVLESFPGAPSQLPAAFRRVDVIGGHVGNRCLVALRWWVLVLTRHGKW
jgi:hypothetical protein